MTGHNFAASLALGNVCQGRRMMAVHFHHEGDDAGLALASYLPRRQGAVSDDHFPSDYVRSEAEADLSAD